MAKILAKVIGLLGGKRAIKKFLANFLVKLILKADKLNPEELADDVHDQIEDKMVAIFGVKAAERLEDGWLVRFAERLVQKWKSD